MVDRAKNIGTIPIDGEDEDIYSCVEAWNQFSLWGFNEKYDKKRPPPTYIDFLEYEDLSK